MDLDLLVDPADAAALRSALEAEGIQWHAAEKEFRSSTGVAIQCVLAGESQGRGQETIFPSPADPKHITTIEGLPVLSLASLTNQKLLAVWGICGGRIAILPALLS